MFEQQDLPDKVKKLDFDASTNLAIRAWNLLGRRMDWQGLEVVSEVLGIEDIELLIAQLEVIRDYG